MHVHTGKIAEPVSTLELRPIGMLMHYWQCSHRLQVTIGSGRTQIQGMHEHSWHIGMHEGLLATPAYAACVALCGDVAELLLLVYMIHISTAMLRLLLVRPCGKEWFRSW
jgi:hypothetical protein